MASKLPRKDVQNLGLSLRHPSGESEDDYAGLSIIEVTPRSDKAKNKARTLTSYALESHCKEENPSKLARSNSGSSLAFSVASHPEHSRGQPKKEEPLPNSVGSFLSNLTRGWSRSGGSQDAKKAGDVGCDSPPSIIARKSLRGPSRPTRNSVADEKELLKKPIFSSIDGPDAQEFHEFLHGDGGESHRIPVLCLVDYGGRGAYASDIFVLMHNTIRRELFDVFEIVTVIRQEYLSMTVNDLYNLRKWWRFFVILWQQYNGYEKVLIAPMIQQICLVDGRSDVLLKRLGPLRETREWLELKMEEITSYIEEFERLPAGRALVLFCRTVDAFADRAMIYFAGQERVLPPFIENYHGEEVKLAVELQLMERVRKSQYFPELVVSIVRWMGTVQGFSSPRTQTRERDKWLNSHLFWTERQCLSRYYQKYEATHGSVLSHFRNRLQNSDSL